MERLNNENISDNIHNEEFIEAVEIVEDLGDDINIGNQILEDSKDTPENSLYKLESETVRNGIKVVGKIKLDEKESKRKRW